MRDWMSMALREKHQSQSEALPLGVGKADDAGPTVYNWYGLRV